MLGDRLFCTYCDIVRLQGKGVDVVFRLHALRHVDFRRGRRLGRDDHVVVWKKPARCPKWLNDEDFQAGPCPISDHAAALQVP